MNMHDAESTEMVQGRDTRYTTRNEMFQKVTGRAYATTTRTGGYQATNYETNVSPLSSKKR